MIDFTISSASRFELLLISLLYFGIVLFNWKKALYRNPWDDSKKRERRWLLFFAMLFSVVSIYQGDFYHYQYVVHEVDVFGDSFSFEDIYAYLILFVKRNYLLFRIFVWGGALVLIDWAIRVNGVDRYGALFFFFVVFISTFDYSRASLGMAVYFLGLSFLLNYNKSISKLLLGVVFLLSSFFFHRSMLLLILFTPAVFLPINRYTVLVFLLLIVITAGPLQRFMVSFADTVMDMNDNFDISSRMDVYLNAERRVANFSFIGRLIAIWSYAFYYVTFLVDAKFILLKKSTTIISSPIRKMFSVEFAIVLFSTFVLITGFGSRSFFYRYLFMTMIPSSIITGYLYQKGIMPIKTFVYLLLFGGGYIAFSFIYRVLLVGA